jgi:hypothetical protein
MIEAMTAYTGEIDDADCAVSEILAQTGAWKLRKNSLGILMCHEDFIATGAVRALSEKLSFDVVGVSTIASAVPGGGGPNVLSLLVLTSDDVFFSAALSRPLAPEDWKVPVEEVYRSALEGLGVRSESCPLGLVFAPFALWAGGDEFLRVLDETAGGVPFFGSLPAGHSPVERATFVMFNGGEYDDRLAVVLLSGELRPRFACSSIAEEKISMRKGIVTDSVGNIIKAVNGMPVLSYLEKLGLVSNGELLWTVSIPVSVNYGDGTKPVSLVIVEQTPEGYVRMGGSVPVNSAFSVGSVDRGSVLASVADVIKLVEEEQTSVFFFFSCALRSLVLDLDQTAEIDRLKELMDGSVPYLFACSGGEICPLGAGDGRLVNRFHNITAIGCAL